MERTIERPRTSRLDTPLTSLISINWETALFVVLIVLAVATRFWDLGARAMSHDESLHTQYAWQLYVGKGYQHNPMMHGPFKFHLTALFYFLFGDSDYTSRMGPALFGVILVALPWLLRKWLGRTGTIITSFLLLISPSILYHSRYIRDEIFMLVWEVLLVVALFRYLDERRNRWLYLGAVVLSLAIASMEVSYIFGLLAVTFLVAAVAWEWAEGPTRSVLVLGGFVLGLLLAVLKWNMGAQLTTFAALSAGLLPIMSFISLYIPSRKSSAILDMVVGFDLRAIGLALVVFAIIYILLFTTFFTNPAGLLGIPSSISYWLAQQPVQRGTQPWYYYLILVPLYEFTPLLLSLIATVVYAVRRDWRERFADVSGSAASPAGRLFVPFLVYWWIAIYFIMSWAGEKMPWLTVYMALPLALMAGRFLGDVFDRTDWVTIRKAGGALIPVLLIPTLITFVVIVTGERPFTGLSLQRLGATMRWLSGVVVLIVLAYALYRTMERVGWRPAGQVVFATCVGIMALFSIRAAWMFSYINFAMAREMLVYAHATPDIKTVEREINELAARLGQGNELKIAYDNLVPWPMEWYLRNYKNKHYFGEQPSGPLDAPIVLVGLGNEDKVKPSLGNNYVRRQYRLIWWPIEDYKQFEQDSFNKFIKAITDPQMRESAFKIWLWRDYGKNLDAWPDTRFAVYVRKDVVSKIWEYGAAGPELAQVEDELDKKRVQAAALAVFGSQGPGPGQLVNPKGIKVDDQGNVWVVDAGNSRVQAFDPQGTVIRQWGSNGSGSGMFKDDPWGLAVDSQRGFVYVADTWNHRIQKFDLAGQYLLEWGAFADTGGTAVGNESRFWGPRDIAVDADGNLYVTDTGNKRIQKFDPDGKFLGQWGGVGFAPGQFNEPVGIAISKPGGDIFVADTWNRRVQRFDKDMNPLAQWTVPGWSGESVNNKPYIAVDAGDNVYITDPEGYQVLKYDNKGTLLAVFGQFGTDNKSFNLPTGIAIAPNGDLLVTDSFNHRVMRFAGLR
jgi:uncharacterized protein (TIGR03663 family)